MIHQLKKDFDILSLKVDMMTAIGKENLEEKGVVLDDDASLLRVIQNIKNISQSGGSGSLSYDSISYGKDPDGNDALILEDDGVTYYAACEYENGKLKSIIYQGQTIELQYDGDKLTSIGDTEIDLSGAPTNESGETAQSNHSVTSYEVWGETLTLAYNDSAEMNVAECTKDITNIKSGVYKMFIDDNSYNALVMVEDEIVINMGDENICGIASNGESALFGTTIDVEGTHTIKLITQTDNVEDCAVYSQNRSSDATTYIYITNGFTGGNVRINISADNVIVFDHDVTFDGIDGFAFYHGNSNYDYHVPYLGQYIEQNKTIVIQMTQTNTDGIIVTKTISSQPQLVDGYYVWGNSDLFVLPS